METEETRQETAVEEVTEAQTEETKTPREIALEETLQGLRQQLDETNAVVKELKIQNERLILSMPAKAEVNDGELFGIFDKYDTKR